VILYGSSSIMAIQIVSIFQEFYTFFKVKCRSCRILVSGIQEQHFEAVFFCAVRRFDLGQFLHFVRVIDGYLILPNGKSGANRHTKDLQWQLRLQV